MNKKLVTIITESILESMLVKDLKILGAKGYTIIEARGSGAHGTRSADWGQSQNIKIEIICNDSTAHAILDHCQKNYCSNYAMVVFTTDIQVMRSEKF
jgi:nitrogen regulatory protein PII